MTPKIISPRVHSPEVSRAMSPKNLPQSPTSPKNVQFNNTQLEEVNSDGEGENKDELTFDIDAPLDGETEDQIEA